MNLKKLYTDVHKWSVDKKTSIEGLSRSMGMNDKYVTLIINGHGKAGVKFWHRLETHAGLKESDYND